ncbi:hypothetical protein [Paenibacillus agaridevorans]|nr:hypothetical protein [Paenibacillus agaridevorans]
MNKTYAELLSQYIEESNLSLGEISSNLAMKNIKVDRSYISKLKNGNKPPASEEVTKALADITGGDYKKLLIAAQMEKMKPVWDDLGEEGFEEFLNSVIGHMVTREHFVEEFNSKLEAQCKAEGTVYKPYNAEEIKKHFERVSLDDKIILSQFFSYNHDRDNKTYTVVPYNKLPSSDSKEKNLESEYKRIYDELGFGDSPPNEEELLTLKIALNSYRMGRNIRE